VRQVRQEQLSVVLPPVLGVRGGVGAGSFSGLGKREPPPSGVAHCRAFLAHRGALRKAPVRRGTQPRKAAKSLSGALGAPFPNNRRLVVALGGWRFRVGEVSRRGAFCVQGRVYWWEACAKCAREGFRSLGRLRNAAHGGAPAGARTVVLVRQGCRDPPSGRVFGRSGGCRPGR